MELPRRDRGSVRTAKDIEMKYDLGRVAKLDKKLDVNSETLDRLVEQSVDLLLKYDNLEKRVLQNEGTISDLALNKADKKEVVVLRSDLIKIKELVKELKENQITQEDLEEWLEGFSATKYIYYYTTISDSEWMIKLPSVYESTFCVDVFVNGMKLEKTKYDIISNGLYDYVSFESALDVKGTLIEIDMMKGKEEIVV